MDIRNRFFLAATVGCALLLVACGSTSPLRPTDPSAGASPAAPAPPAPPQPGTPDAVLEISDFRVYPALGLDYAADLEVRETGGKSNAVITAVEINLLDLGVNGRVPWSTSAAVPAGGRVVLLSSALDAYGDVPFSFGGGTSNSRFSVAITFTDEQGRRGTVNAITSLRDR